MKTVSPGAGGLNSPSFSSAAPISARISSTLALSARWPAGISHKRADPGERHHHRRGDENGHRQLALAKAGRRHHHQFAVAVQPGQGEERAEEKRDRQDDDQKARQDQHREIDEGGRRLAAIDDQIEKPAATG